MKEKINKKKFLGIALVAIVAIILLTPSKSQIAEAPVDNLTAQAGRAIAPMPVPGLEQQCTYTSQPGFVRTVFNGQTYYDYYIQLLDANGVAVVSTWINTQDYTDGDARVSVTPFQGATAPEFKITVNGLAPGNYVLSINTGGTLTKNAKQRVPQAAICAGTTPTPLPEPQNLRVGVETNTNIRTERNGQVVAFFNDFRSLFTNFFENVRILFGGAQAKKGNSTNTGSGFGNQ